MISETTVSPTKNEMHVGFSEINLQWHKSVLMFGGRLIVAMVIGGVASMLLQVLGMQPGFAFAVGLLSAIVVFGLVAISSTRLIRVDSLGHVHAPQRYVTIGNVISAMPVDGLEDFGPGYVVETAEGERIFFAGQIVADYDDEGESLPNTLVLRVSDSGELLGMDCSGQRVPIDLLRTINILSLNIGPTIGFHIFTPGDYPRDT